GLQLNVPQTGVANINDPFETWHKFPMRDANIFITGVLGGDAGGVPDILARLKLVESSIFHEGNMPDLTSSIMGSIFRAGMSLIPLEGLIAGTFATLDLLLDLGGDASQWSEEQTAARAQMARERNIIGAGTIGRHIDNYNLETVISIGGGNVADFVFSNTPGTQGALDSPNRINDRITNTSQEDRQAASEHILLDFPDDVPRPDMDSYVTPAGRGVVTPDLLSRYQEYFMRLEERLTIDAALGR
ncbi:MAG: hypothetical protein FWG11_08920, partial [Promicromonosporaceae bacterium]|nr:hypothetical protein [Promicromonosporaceae bacterium]